MVGKTKQSKRDGGNRSYGSDQGDRTNPLWRISPITPIPPIRAKLIVRQVNREGRTVADRRIDLDATAVSAGDAAYGGQAESGAVGVGRIERAENAVQVFVRDAASRVGDGDDRMVWVVVRMADLDGDRAPVLDGFDGVENEIEDCVFELRGVGGQHRRGRGRYEFDADALAVFAGQTRARQTDGLLRRLVDRSRAEVERARTRAFEQHLYGIVDAIDFVFDVGEDFAFGRVFGATLQQNIHRALNARERIFDFMRESGSEFAEAGELLYAGLFAFARDHIGHVAHHHYISRHVAAFIQHRRDARAQPLAGQASVDFFARRFMRSVAGLPRAKRRHAARLIRAAENFSAGVTDDFVEWQAEHSGERRIGFDDVRVECLHAYAVSQSIEQGFASGRHARGVWQNGK